MNEENQQQETNTEIQPTVGIDDKKSEEGTGKKREGRPFKFETPKEMQVKIDEYFKTTPKDEWTITGLAMALDTFRSLLCDYEERDEFYYTIKKAKQKVENGYEIDLKKAGRSGTIFALKNFDWKDKTEQDMNVKGTISLTDLFKKSNE